MRIAIMTWFHYRNYGTALQVSALYYYLTKAGHKVDVIEYIPLVAKNKTIQSFRLSEVIGRHKNKSISFPVFWGKHFCDEDKDCLFQRYLDARISLTRKCKTKTDLENLNSDYDAFICGSDQIWAPSVFDPHYFLDFVYNTEKLIAYSPSIGLTRINDRFVEKQMRDLINRFHYLSVRESSGQEIIQALTGKKAEVVVDPTLLLSPLEWEKYCDITEESSDSYLLVYFLGNNNNHWKSAYKLAEKKNLEVRIIPVYEKDLQRDGCIGDPVGPKEFVSLIRNATYICTDSFHGSLFSIVFQKQFTAIERFEQGNPINQNARLFDLFNRIQINKSLARYNTSEIQDEIIDYREVNKLKSEFCTLSKLYLDEALRNVEFLAEKDTQENSVLVDYSLCCGCGACANVCSVNAIMIKQDDKGFFKANVDREKCVNCGKCVSVCPFNKYEDSIKAMEECELYSYKDYDKNILSVSSSGGFAYRLSAYLMGKGYAIAGCTFDKKTQTAKHLLIKSIEDLNLLQGSKYMQSDFSDVIEEIKQCKKPVAIFGTPCQISASRKLFKDKNDYLYIDLICHGVPSYNLYIKYRDYLSKKYRMDKNTFSVQYRYKPRGWRDIYIYCESGAIKHCFHQNDDLYFRMFETGNCYMQTCYECKWRDCTTADLRIGDYWGVRYEYDDTGVSMVASANERGLTIIKQMENEELGRIKKCPITDYTQCQQMVNFHEPLFYNELMRRLADENTDLSLIVDKYSLPFERKEQSRKEHIKTVAKLVLDSKND